MKKGEISWEEFEKIKQLIEDNEVRQADLVYIPVHPSWLRPENAEKLQAMLEALDETT